MSNGNLVNQGSELSAGLNISSEGELQVSSTATSVLQEIQGAIFLAKQFPRNENVAWEKLQNACKRKSLAEKAEWTMKISGKPRRGPSVHLARVAAQNYGNIRYGGEILRDDIDRMSIRGWFWDIENNIKISADDTFSKLIYRTNPKTEKKEWRKPDERELRMEVNRRMAILIRNCILQGLPVDYIDDGIETSRATVRSNIKDPQLMKKQIISRFSELGVTVEMINKYLGRKEWTIDDLADLKSVILAIKDGAGSINDYFNFESKADSEPDKPNLSAANMKPGDPENHQTVSGKLNLNKKEAVDKSTGEIKPEREDKESAKSDPETEPEDDADKPASEEQVEKVRDLLTKKKFPKKGPAATLKTIITEWLDSHEKTAEEAAVYISNLESLPNEDF